MTAQQVLPALQVLLLSLGPGLPLVIALALLPPSWRRPACRPAASPCTWSPAGPSRPAWTEPRFGLAP
jgi:hypothetical protein